MITRRALLAASLAVAALPARAITPAASTIVDGPAAPIQALLDALLKSMKAGDAAPFPQRYKILAPAVEVAFDIPATLQAAVGPRWSTFTPAQQKQLLDAFRTFTIARYAENFDGFSGEKLELLPGTRQSGADQIVPTQIVPARGDAVRIDYVMRQSPQGWRAVDVLLNGTISQVAVQRSDFRALLATGGPEALAASLRDKVATISGHTL